MDLAPQRIGRYRVERLLGSGAFANVWLGRDETLQADVAIKVLADNWSHNLDVRERFVDEARILWRADHERLVRVYAIDELPGGQPYFVMAYADAGSLADRMPPGHRFPTTEAVAVGIEVAAALQVLHDLGFVHRDLKPSNILFRSVPSHHSQRPEHASFEQVVLADLGLAKDLARASGFTITTGTPAYMAPEQALATGGVDQRADVYSLGVIVYQLLTGALPFPSDDSADAVRARRTRPTPFADHGAVVPNALEQVIIRALDTDRERRFASAAELGAALEGARAALAPANEAGGGDRPAHDRRPRRPRRPPRSPRSRPRVRPMFVAVSVAVVLTVLAGAIAARAVRSNRAKPSGVASGAGLVERRDLSGRVRVSAPGAWNKVAGAGWNPSFSGANGETAPALTVSTDLDRYSADLSTPGLFATTARSFGDASGVEALLAQVVHPNCDVEPSVVSDAHGRRWSVRRFRCAPGTTFVEAATTETVVLVYVQVKLVGDEDTSLTGQILDSVRVH